MNALPGSQVGELTHPRLAERIAAYWVLIKSRQTMLLLATGIAGYLSADPADMSLRTVALMILSLFAAISGTTVLNMVIDRDIDARMERTAWRPLPSGQLSVRAATLYGLALLLLGLGLAFHLSTLFGWAVFGGFFFDFVIYTLWLKRRTALSIVFGGISGGMPILAGRVLATGRVDLLGLLLALSVLLWIPSHIVTFSIKYAEDYRRASLPTWPSSYGVDSARRFIARTNGLRGITLVAAGWMLRICPYSLALLAFSGLVTLGLSLWAIVHPSERINHRLFKFASIHMLASMILLTWGALV